MENDMNSRFRLSLIFAALIFSGLAYGALDKIESVLELNYSQFTLPGHEADQVTVEVCETCEDLKLQVNRATVYRVGGFDAQPVTLQNFRAAVRRSDRKKLAFYLGYAPDTNVITRLIVKGDDLSGVALSNNSERRSAGQDK
jgi:hypothetical protein